MKVQNKNWNDYKKPPSETQNMVVKMKYPKRNKNKRPVPKKMNNAENLVNAVGNKSWIMYFRKIDEKKWMKKLNSKLETENKE